MTQMGVVNSVLPDGVKTVQPTELSAGSAEKKRRGHRSANEAQQSFRAHQEMAASQAGVVWEEP